ncbi:MAG: 2Fe-2S iron-sulfur cluster binding domain-containing protein [Pirellulaceae bacterium]|nr:2Fe-2S iron-sulfur cluster binding domain-containing protein [Pirellulaceae bacterium]
MISLTINNVPVEVPEGTTILCAAKQAGVRIPTLCYVEGLKAVGACRVCAVEVEGARNLVASCSMPAAEGMKVLTNTRRVRESRRAVVELLLSEHNGECQTCDRNEDCELQALAAELGIREISYVGEKTRKRLDVSTPALVRDMGKCIKCRRCVSVCQETQNVGALFPQNRGFDTVIGPAFGHNLSTVACVQCGQCAAVCPVGAITEKDQIDDVWKALDKADNHVVVQTAPAIRAALGECFGYPPGTLVTGKMVAALRRLGFDAIFDTNFTADLTIMEEGTELLTRLKTAILGDEGRGAGDGKNANESNPQSPIPNPLPMFTSCSPGWIKYLEYFHSDMIPNVSTCKSPQQMFGAVAKTYYAEKLGKKPEQIIVVSIMPCTAKKFECQRPEMDSSGTRDVDIVLTTRELGKMIRAAGIDFASLPDEEMDAPLGLSSGAADIFANTGGVMEAAIRTAYELVTGRELPLAGLHVSPVAGLDGVKEASLKIEGAKPEWSFLEGVTLEVAVAHGLGNAEKVISAIKSGEKQYHFVEIMACPGGCIGGGGQPRYTNNKVRQARIAAIYREDEGKKLRKSHENPAIAQLYAEFLTEGPLGHRSHELLHTTYTQRDRF